MRRYQVRTVRQATGRTAPQFSFWRLAQQYSANGYESLKPEVRSGEVRSALGVG